MTIEEFIQKTDYKFLREQKETFLKYQFSFKEMQEAMEGIINFIDAFQDMAALYVGEKEVFNIDLENSAL